ncbi:MAG: site-specific integrase [Defluviitaleaceae bacterium]|nr:site-specific integrase [Defluviitaleaceae bacterium]
MTGSLQEKKGMFYMVLNIKDGAGNRKQKWIPTGLSIKGNKRKAEQQLHAILTEYSDGDFVEPTNILLCDYLKDWIESRESRLQVTTYMNYVHMLNKHLYPYFKKTKLQLTDVNPNALQKYHSTKAKEGLSPNTIIKHHAVIRTALQQAVKSKLIKENPCNSVEKPKRKRFVSEFYNAKEVRELLLVAKSSPIKVPIFIAAYFGLRRSEVLGLRWSAIDFSNGFLTVRHKVVRTIKDGKLINVATDDLKTDSSYRVLPLDEHLIKFFKETRHYQEENYKLCGDSYDTKFNDYVCVNPMGVRFNPDYVSNAFVKLIDHHGMKRIRFHDLRHSCASLLLSLGYSMKEIQEWLGHSNYQTTANLYSHVDPRNKKEMIRGLSNALGVDIKM